MHYADPQLDWKKINHLTNPKAFLLKPTNMFNQISSPVQDHAFSSEPLNILNPTNNADFSALSSIHLLENGSRSARERWQHSQLVNLIQHANHHSNFWNKRLSGINLNNPSLKDIPLFTRTELNQQVLNEGPLCRKEYLQGVNSYPSSGSTSTPVTVYSMRQNARYNELRSLAQYLIEGRDLNYNWTYIKPADGLNLKNKKQNIQVEKHSSWIGNLSHLFKHGQLKKIQFDGNLEQLIEELLKDQVGYLASTGSHLDLLINYGGADFLKQLDIHMWLHHSDNFDASHRDLLKKIGISSSSNYSCTEIGPIAVECTVHAGFYHLVHSNVIVEIDETSSTNENGEQLNKLLITHLHSYATPIIRYDVGDYGQLHETCPCGHDGKTLSKIWGRKKHFLKGEDGELIPFHIYSKPLLDILTFKEFFSYQSDFRTINVEFGGRTTLSESEISAVTNYIKKISLSKFNVNVSAYDNINWDRNPKRLPFISYVD